MRPSYPGVEADLVVAADVSELYTHPVFSLRGDLVRRGKLEQALAIVVRLGAETSRHRVDAAPPVQLPRKPDAFVVHELTGQCDLAFQHTALRGDGDVIVVDFGGCLPP